MHSHDRCLPPGEPGAPPPLPERMAEVGEVFAGLQSDAAALVAGFDTAQLCTRAAGREPVVHAHDRLFCGVLTGSSLVGEIDRWAGGADRRFRLG